MLLKISITPDGMEQYLKRGENNVNSWNLCLTTPAFDTIPESNILLSEIEVTLPTPEQMMPIVLAKLREKEAEIQMEAHREMMQIRERRNDIMMLTTDASVK